MQSTASNSRSFHGTDEPYPIANDAPEWERLNDMHRGFNDYLGNKLSFAPIRNPKKILEIGSGSGAWAIQAAQTYPEAEVLAIDISPLPPRPLPSNLKFENVNVTQPLPLDPASFDVVHARLILVHLPDSPEILKRIIQLVKPGGFLIIEDIEHNLFGDVGPGISKFYEVYHSYMKPRGVDHMTGPKLEPLLKESGAFSEVHARHVEAPFSGKADDPALGALGRMAKLSCCRAYKAFDPKLVAHGLTKQVQDGWYRDVDDSSRDVHVRVYFVWAQKAE